VTLGNKPADMSIVETDPPTCSHVQTCLSDLTMAPGAPSSITEFLRQETRELRSSPQKRIVAHHGQYSCLFDRPQLTTHKDSKVRLIIPGDVRADQPISILSTLGSALLRFSPANRSTALTMRVRITG
jgi:hypothetical protein